MTKSRTKTARKAVGKKTAQAKLSRKPVDMGAVRKKVEAMVGHSAVKMVKTTMDEVDKGHYAAMKYLFEMIGLFPGGIEQELVGDDSMAKTLLKRLRITEEVAGDTAVTKDPEELEALAGEDTVK